MKVDYISDLHLDFWIKETNPQNPKFQKQLNNFINTILPKKNDVLIVAGDLGHYYAQDTAFLTKMKDYYDNILIVPGNHDMYLVSDSIKQKYQYNSVNRMLEMKRFCAENNIHYLDGNTINIDGVNFSGSGMHWDGSFGKNLFSDCTDGELLGHWENVMNDARLIYMKGSDHIKSPTMYGGYYSKPSFKPLDFFKSQKDKLDRITEADVMITHYAPRVPDNMRQRYREDLASSFYYFDGSEYVKNLKPKFWIYGHTHDKVDEIQDGCRFLCNPLGYPGENTYNIIKTFEV